MSEEKPLEARSKAIYYCRKRERETYRVQSRLESLCIWFNNSTVNPASGVLVRSELIQ